MQDCWWRLACRQRWRRCLGVRRSHPSEYCLACSLSLQSDTFKCEYCSACSWSLHSDTMKVGHWTMTLWKLVTAQWRYEMATPSFSQQNGFFLEHRSVTGYWCCSLICALISSVWYEFLVHRSDPSSWGISMTWVLIVGMYQSWRNCGVVSLVDGLEQHLMWLQSLMGSGRPHGLSARMCSLFLCQLHQGVFVHWEIILLLLFPGISVRLLVWWPDVSAWCTLRWGC